MSGVVRPLRNQPGTYQGVGLAAPPAESRAMSDAAIRLICQCWRRIGGLDKSKVLRALDS